MYDITDCSFFCKKIYSHYTTLRLIENFAFVKEDYLHLRVGQLLLPPLYKLEHNFFFFYQLLTELSPKPCFKADYPATLFVSYQLLLRLR